MNQETSRLAQFLVGRIQSGAKKSDLFEELRAVGWSEEEADRAYARALLETGVPAPEASGSGEFAGRASAVEVVVNLFSFILLGILAFALGSLYFEVIGRYFPDPSVDLGMGARASSEAVHYAMAAIIIGYPIYFFSLKLWLGKFRMDEGKAEAPLTKWITYLVLLVTSVTIVGDLIAILFSFLQGELTARFFLKAIVILSIAGAVFGFYALERRMVQYRKAVPRTTFRAFGWGFLAVSAIGIVLGFLVAGSPVTERKRTLDEGRAGNLSSLAGCVNDYTQEFKRLPESLDELSQSTGVSYCASLRDPETGVSYEYRVVRQISFSAEGAEVPSSKVRLSTGSYELCATFALSTEQAEGPTGARAFPLGDDKWSRHGAGRSCDTETVSVKDNANK